MILPYKTGEKLSTLDCYRNSWVEVGNLITNLLESEKYSCYKYLLNRFYYLNQNSESLLNDATFTKEFLRYRSRFISRQDAPLEKEQYVNLLRIKLSKQIENFCLEEAMVGDKPFSQSFYYRSSLVRSILDSEEILVIFNDQLGDCILTFPLLLALHKYFQANKISKKIFVLSKQSYFLKELNNLSSLLFEFIDSESLLSQVCIRKLLVFNMSCFTLNYPSLASAKDSFLLEIDMKWQSFTQEETPVSRFLVKRYSSLPSLVCRKFELLVGQKIFENLDDIKSYIQLSKTQDDFLELNSKYEIKDDEILISISVSSTWKPKEYSPENWIRLIQLIVEKFPNTHVLVMHDLTNLQSSDNKTRSHYNKYVLMVDLLRRSGLKVTNVCEDLNVVARLLNISQLSITPDTGIGHLAGALGTPCVILYYAAHPILWSTPQTRYVIHPKARRLLATNIGLYEGIWNFQNDIYYNIDNDGHKSGVSDLAPNKVFRLVCKILGDKN